MRAVERTRRLIADRIAELGMTERMRLRDENEGAGRGEMAYEVTQADLTTVRITRGPHQSEGLAWITVDLDAYVMSAAEMEESVRLLTARDAALIAQDLLIESEGGDPVDPGPRHHVVDALTRHMALAAGWTAGELCDPQRWNAEPNRVEAGIICWQQRTSVDGTEATADLIAHRRRLKTESLSVGSIPKMTLTEDPGGMRLTIGGVTLPTSVAATLTGTPLDAVVSHRLIDGCGAIIAGVHAYATDETTFTIDLRPVRLDDGAAMEEDA